MFCFCVHTQKKNTTNTNLTGRLGNSTLAAKCMQLSASLLFLHEITHMANRDMIRLIHITDVLQWFLPGFGRAVCQSSLASSLTNCTGETIWIVITWHNLTYFKQRRVRRNQDMKERGKQSIQEQLWSQFHSFAAAPHHSSRCLVDRDKLEPKCAGGKSGSVFYWE